MAGTAETRRLDQTLRAWARRLAWRRGARRSGRAALIGAGGLGVFLAVAIQVPVPAGPFGDPRALAMALGAVALGAAAMPLLWTRFTRREAAQVADLNLETRALFTTAEEVLTRHEAGQPLTDGQRACLERAVAHLNEVTPARVAPVRFGWRWSAGLLPAIMAAAIFAAPMAVDQRAIEDQASLEAASKTLDELTRKDVQRQDSADDEALRQGLRRLTERMQRQEITRHEALEELAEIKRQLDTEQLRRAERASEASRAAQAAARELGRAEQTSRLAQKMSEAAASKTNPEARQQAAREAADQLRELSKLDREARQKAADQLEKAARAAEAAGDPQLAEALQKAADAARSGDPQQLQQAGQQLQQALQQGQPLDAESLEQLAQGIEQAQQQLGQGDLQQQAQNQGQGAGNRINPDDSSISPGPRQWQQGGPNAPGQGKAQGAGTGHSDEETSGAQLADGHQDANRIDDTRTEDQQVEYQELYEAFLLNTGERVQTRVQGTQGDTGKVQTSRGGQQAPGTEDARRVMEKLPVQYARDADKAINDETIPPAYREAVRDYFDRGQ